MFPFSNPQKKTSQFGKFQEVYRRTIVAVYSTMCVDAFSKMPNESLMDDLYLSSVFIVPSAIIEVRAKMRVSG